MFEGVAYHPKYGILVAVEYPINRKKNTQQSIYSLKGKEWHFKTEKYKNSACWVFSGNLPALKRLGLKTSKRIKCSNT